MLEGRHSLPAELKRLYRDNIKLRLNVYSDPKFITDRISEQLVLTDRMEDDIARRSRSSLAQRFDERSFQPLYSEWFRQREDTAGLIQEMKEFEDFVSGFYEYVRITLE